MQLGLPVLGRVPEQLTLHARRAALSFDDPQAAVTDEKMTLTPAHLTPQGVVKLSLGKKRHVLLKPV